jgi:GNAT superfamily N-acetyltransferase
LCQKVDLNAENSAMPIRPMRLPQDLQTMLDVLPRAFQYPENPAWSFNPDELENVTDTVRTIKRLWPILRVLRLLSPGFRDIFDGVIWEEKGQPVGITNVQRMGINNSNSWIIANVGVLPEYRRRGIARKLVEAAIEMAKSRKAKRVILDVIEGNDPAYQLYLSLGFEQFDYGAEFVYSRPTPPADCPLPEGYTVKALTQANWRPTYELVKRITPPNVQSYLPVEESRYRVGLIERVLMPIFETGTRTKRIGVYSSGREIVATANYSARTRPGGVNGLSVTVDPAHSLLASYVIHSLLNEITRIAPGRNIEMRLMSWLAPTIEAAKTAGFEQRMAGNRMGLTLTDH